MAAYTNMTYLIQLSSHCWDCINNVRAALNRMYGVTSVIIDSSYGTVKVTGMVDPHAILSVVQSYDIHARLLSTKPGPHYPYGSYSCADQYLYHGGALQPRPLTYHQPYCGHEHHPGCNIM